MRFVLLLNWFLSQQYFLIISPQYIKDLFLQSLALIPFLRSDFTAKRIL